MAGRPSFCTGNTDSPATAAAVGATKPEECTEGPETGFAGKATGLPAWGEKNTEEGSIRSRHS